jgi:hypothetical protein
MTRVVKERENENMTKNIEDVGKGVKMSTVKDDTTAFSSWNMVRGKEVSRLEFFYEDVIFCLSV